MASNFDKIAAAGKEFVCGLYKQTPSPLVENPISDVLRFAWDSLCGDSGLDNLPAPPSRPFNGGQCVCMVYAMTFSLQGETLGYGEMYGPIKAIRTVLVPRGNNKFDYNVQALCRGPYGNGFERCKSSLDWHTVAYQPLMDNRGDAVLTVFRPKFNESDNCGDLPISYPPAPPVPPGGYTSPPTAITYNDGTDVNVVFNLQPPTSNNTTLPPPICLTATLGGKQFRVCYPPDGVPHIEGVDNSDVLLRDIHDELVDFREEYDNDKHPLPPGEDPSLIPKPLAGDSGGEDDVPNIAWLLVTLLEVPSKAQFGNPTVFFAGWVTFRVNGAYTERQQISYEKSLFRAPEGADGYGVTFTNFARGNVTSYATQ